MSVQVTDNSMQFKGEMNDKVLAVLEAIGLHLEGEAKDELENDPRRVDTGNLRNSITHAVDENEPAVYVGTNVDYGIYVHEGTGIYAVNGDGRKDPWGYEGKDGKWHITHGMKPNRFLKKAVERNEDQIQKYIEEVLKSN